MKNQAVLALAAGTAFGFVFAYTFMSVVKYESVQDQYHVAGLHHSPYLDAEVAEALAKKVRVLCWVMTSPSNFEKKAKHVKATWGKRCNILLFMSTESGTTTISMQLPSTESNSITNRP